MAIKAAESSHEERRRPLPKTHVTTLANHLVHRPNSLEGIMHGSAGPVTQQFGLSAPLPQQHPLFNDGTGIFHDLHVPAEALIRSALFVAHRYFRVPEERPAVFSTTEVAMTVLGSWRRTGEPAHLTMDLALHPVDVVNGVPRGLECESTLSIEGMPCGTGRARMVFLMPKVYRNHRERGRAASRSGQSEHPRPTARTERPLPEAVGRSDPRNVVISTPLSVKDDTMLVQVAPYPAHPVLSEAADHVPAVVLLEASRQAAILLAGEMHDFSADSCVLSGWSANFQGFAEPDLPLYCAASPGPLRHEDRGMPVLPVNLVFSQGSRQVGVVEALVLQDC